MLSKKSSRNKAWKTRKLQMLKLADEGKKDLAGHWTPFWKSKCNVYPPDVQVV